MNRYHKKVWFPKEHEEKLKDITAWFNGQPYTYSRHCLENLKYRAIDMQKVLTLIKETTLEYGQIFEYYVDHLGNLEKLCYRLNYNENSDIILVVSRLKNIVTIYLNSTDDSHETLKEEIYTRG